MAAENRNGPPVEGTHTFANLAAQIKSKQRNKGMESAVKNPQTSKSLTPAQKLIQNLPAAPEKNNFQALRKETTPVAAPQATKAMGSRGLSPLPAGPGRRPPALNPVARAATQPVQGPDHPPKQNLPSTAAPVRTNVAGMAPEKSLSAEQLFTMAKMGYTQWEYGKLDRAQAIFQTLVVQKPDEPWFRCALGSIFQKQRQFAQAIQQYNIALQLDPKDIPSRVNRGEIFLKVGKNREAHLDLTQALRLDATGKNPAALRARSLLAALKHKLPG